MPIQLDKFDDDDRPYSMLALPKRPEDAGDKLAREIYVVGAGPPMLWLPSKTACPRSACR
jgi:hypothetical protein